MEQSSGKNPELEGLNSYRSAYTGYMNNQQFPQSGAGNNAGRPPHAGVRIGDDERGTALDLLGQHFAAGRLDLAEYDERCDKATKAQVQGDLSALFTDLPRIDTKKSASLAPRSPGMPQHTDQRVYTAQEIEEMRRRGGRPKTGAMWLTVIGSIVASILLEPAWSGAPILLWLIPTAFVLLYVLKIGPKEWHTPSLQALERERARQLHMEHRKELQQRKAQRQLQQEQLKARAVEQMNRFMGGTGQ